MSPPALPLELWLLRILVRGPREGGRPLSPPPSALRALGLLDGLNLTPRAMAKQLAARLATLDEGKGIDRSAVILRNVKTLGRMFGLDAVERDLVALLAHIEQEEALGDLFACFEDVSLSTLMSILAAATDLDITSVRSALRPRAPLVASGLVQLGRNHLFRERPIMLVSGVADALHRERASPASLARQFFHRSVRASLRLSDFAHMADDVSLLRQFVGAAVAKRKRGINVLLHGIAGTGKTELARALAADLRLRLYAVNDDDEDGDGIDGTQRLKACALAQRVLARSSGGVLLFDEMEDAFPRRASALFGPSIESTDCKSWTHRLLEENAVPTLWVTNNVDHMDPATLRRFALAVELRSPPPQARRRLLARRLPMKLSEKCIERYASDERVTLAHIDQATAVVRLIGLRSPAKAEAALSRVVDGALALTGERRSAGCSALSVLGPYDLRLVNADFDLDRLVRALAKAPSAAICLHGASGTGKTAFVAHVAERLGLPLRVERASDLLRAFVGETEQKIAHMFERARDERCVLLLDEADSFLRDRHQATRSWEVTTVNELLVQMEAHRGIFFCATNLVETLDAASLRRFALKIELRPLTPEQRWSLFEQLVARLPDEEGARIRRDLDRLSSLTAGDFAAAARRLALMTDGFGGAELVGALRDECAMKRDGARMRIGFSG